MNKTIVYLLAALVSACSATPSEPTGTSEQAVTAQNWTSMQTSAMSGSPLQHLCLSAQGTITSGTPVVINTCSASNVGTSFTLVPSSSGVPMGTFTPNVRIEAKNADGSLSGFCVAPGTANASTALASCASSSTALHYQYGAIYTNSFLCLQNVANGSGQLPWINCAQGNTGWEPLNLTCYMHAATSPGDLYANASPPGNAGLNEEPPSSTVVDGVSQPTSRQQFCANFSSSSQTLGANVGFILGACTGTASIQEFGVAELTVQTGVPTLFGYGRANLAGLGWDGLLFDNSNKCWEETSSVGQIVDFQQCLQTSAEAWELVCAGH